MSLLIERYQLLLEAARSMGQAADLDELLDYILGQSQKVLEAEACSIFLHDPQTEELVIHSALGGKSSELGEVRIPKGKGIAGAVFESKKSIRIDDAQNDPRHYGKIDQKTGFITRSLLTVPLLSKQGECVGVIQALNRKDRASFNEEDQTLCEAFAALIVSALLRIERHHKQIAEAHLNQQLELAKEIQHSFLPPSQIQLEPCTIYMHYAAAQTVGGDFLFAHPVGDKHYLMGLGDVSGKGFAAALTMARVTAMLQISTHELKDNFETWLRELNRFLCQDLRSNQFIALILLLLDHTTGEIQLCNAGQPPVLKSFHGTEWQILDLPKSPPLGVIEDWKYEASHFKLERADRYLFFSDGLVEAKNKIREEFGLERILSSTVETRTSLESFQEILASWKEFQKNAPQHDDVTFFMLHWKGSSPQKELITTCNLNTLIQIRVFSENWAQFAGFDDITVGRIVLAIDEAVTNIFRHAYYELEGPLICKASMGNNMLQFELEDRGKPANPEKIIGRKLEELRTGGLGTVVIRQVFDEVKYIPLSKGTLLTLKKKLPILQLR